MKIQGFCAVLFALALTTNAVSDCPDGSGKCDVKDSAAMLQSRLNIEEQAAEDESQEAPTFELEKHGGQTGCPGGWVTGQAIGGSGFRQESVGKADSEDHCIEKVNAEHPDANGATVCMHNHCGGVRTCYADYGMTGTNLAHDGHYDHHETCFFQPQSLLQQIADGEMSGDDSAFIADETEIDEVADEVEEKDDAENYQVVEVKDACNPCDTACVARTSQETFAKCDVDQDNKLSAKEVQDCSVDETGESASGSQSKFVALGEIVSDAKAMEFISYYDEDKDGELTPDEWLKAEVPCEANFVEEGKVISEETVIAKCISNVVKKVFRS
jgi:Ca2+-binding EF-hand superfamily protein